MRGLQHIGRIAAVVALVQAGVGAFAQQDPMYSQYMFNTLAFNPAYAGSADVFTAMALSRNQWVGFDGAPATQTLSLNSPLPGGKLALGGNLIHDVAGPATQNSAFLDIAYRIRTGKNTRLSFGLSGDPGWMMDTGHRSAATTSCWNVPAFASFTVACLSPL